MRLLKFGGEAIFHLGSMRRVAHRKSPPGCCFADHLTADEPRFFCPTRRRWGGAKTIPIQSDALAKLRCAIMETVKRGDGCCCGPRPAGDWWRRTSGFRKVWRRLWAFIRWLPEFWLAAAWKVPSKRSSF